MGGETSTSIWWRVLTGAARYVRHYHPVRKAPNCVLTVDASAGANDGLLKLVVKTGNRLGIAKGQPIVLDYGEGYDPSKFEARFRILKPFCHICLC